MFGHIAEVCNNKVRCVRCGGDHSFNDCANKETPKCCRCNKNHSAAYLGCTKYKDAVKIRTIKQNEKITYAEATKKFHRTKDPIPAQPEGNKEFNNPTAPTAEKPKPPRLIPKQSGRRHTQFDLNTEQTGRNTPTTTEKPKSADFYPTASPVTSAEEYYIDKIPKRTDLNITINSLDFLAFIVFVINNLEHETTNSNRIRLVVEAAKSCLGVDTIHPQMIHQRLST